MLCMCMYSIARANLLLWVLSYLVIRSTIMATRQNIHETDKVNIYIYIYIYIYTGCPRRNVPDFGRVFLMLKYTDITQNTYIQS